jgi:hypothetical protein
VNVLVVTTVADVVTALAGEISEQDTVKVVVPAVDRNVLDWLANDQSAFTRAEDAAAQASRELPGDASAGVGEADVELAIRDALATFPADEIILAVRSGDGSSAVERTAARSASRGEIDGVPVRVVTLERA